MKRYLLMSATALMLAGLVGCTSTQNQDAHQKVATKSSTATSAAISTSNTAANYLHQVASIVEEFHVRPLTTTTASQITVGLAEGTASYSPVPTGTDVCVSLSGNPIGPIEGVRPVCFTAGELLSPVGQKTDSLIAMPVASFNRLAGEVAYGRMSHPEQPNEFGAFLMHIGMACVGW